MQKRNTFGRIPFRIYQSKNKGFSFDLYLQEG